MIVNSLARAFVQWPFTCWIRLLAGVLAPPEVFGVVNELSEDDGPRRRERPPCPPEMQRGRVPVADRLLPRRRRR